MIGVTYVTLGNVHPVKEIITPELRSKIMCSYFSNTNLNIYVSWIGIKIKPVPKTLFFHFCDFPIVPK